MRLIIFFLLITLSVKAQTEAAAKKANQKLRKKSAPEEIELLDKFSQAIIENNRTKLSAILDKEQYEFQMRMYLTDTFMFNQLGDPKDRDSLEIQNFYVRESFALSQMEEDELLKKQKQLNFYAFNTFDQVKKILWFRSKAFGEAKLFYFLLYTKNGKSYLGKVMLIDTLNGLSVSGPMG